MTAPVKTAELLERLQRHYIKPGENFPGGIFVPEVGLNGAVGSSRRCDAVYVGFTNSSGRLMVGHEIKVSRADWLHELDQPAKADTWADGCQAWYVVAPSVEIVKPEELPHGWGLMVINPRTKTRLDVVVKSHTGREDEAPPWRLVRSVMARHDTLRAGVIAEARLKAHRDVQAEVNELRARAVSHSNAETERLSRVLHRVRAEGGEEVRYLAVTDDDLVAALIDLTNARSAARSLHWEIDRIVRAVRELASPFSGAYGPLAELLAQASELEHQT